MLPIAVKPPIIIIPQPAVESMLSAECLGKQYIELWQASSTAWSLFGHTNNGATAEALLQLLLLLSGDPAPCSIILTMAMQQPKACLDMRVLGAGLETAFEHCHRQFDMVAAMPILMTLFMLATSVGFGQPQNFGKCQVSCPTANLVVSCNHI